MAFVFRSERGDIVNKNSSNLGPGAYIGLGKDILIIYNSIFVFTLL